MALILSMTACSGGDEGSSSTADNSGSSEAATYTIAMVTDVGGINDQSFNQSAWRAFRR